MRPIIPTGLAATLNALCTASLIVILAGLLGGCATGPTYSAIEQRMPPTPEGEGRVFFYRPAALTAGALRPAILLNDLAVGKAEPRGFLFVDRTPGDYTVKTSVLIGHAKNFNVTAGQTQYVRLTSSVGVLAGHIIPQLVDESRARRELQGLAYTGSAELLPD